MVEGLKIDMEQALSFDDVCARLKRMTSILTAIEAGELLSGLPECPAARANHAVALDLLSMLDAELRALAEQFEGGWASA